MTRLALDLPNVSFGELGQQLPNEVNLLLAVLRKRVTEGLDDSFALLCLFVDFAENGSQVLVDVLFQDLCQAFSERPCSQKLGVEISVDRVVSEVLVFLVESLCHFDLIVDVFL